LLGVFSRPAYGLHVISRKPALPHLVHGCQASFSLRVALIGRFSEPISIWAPRDSRLHLPYSIKNLIDPECRLLQSLE